MKERGDLTLPRGSKLEKKIWDGKICTYKELIWNYNEVLFQLVNVILHIIEYIVYTLYFEDHFCTSPLSPFTTKDY